MIFSFVRAAKIKLKPITLKPTNIHRIITIMHVINVDSLIITIVWRYLSNA